MTKTDFDYICNLIDEYAVEVPQYPRWSIEIGDDWDFVPMGGEDILKAKIQELQNYPPDDCEKGVTLYYETDASCNGLHHVCDIICARDDDEEEEEEDKYPTIEEILSKMKELKEDENEWDDDTIYDAICEWDDKFADDPNWFDEEDTDVKDSLRDRVRIHLGLKE